jgi:excinuclease UvrABC helicase subunit UvrB
VAVYYRQFTSHRKKNLKKTKSWQWYQRNYNNNRGSDTLPAGKQINHVLIVSMTKISPFSKASKRALGPSQPTIEWVSASFWRKMKQPCREADHSPPLRDKIKNAYS